jgi:hypothetical protein
VSGPTPESLKERTVKVNNGSGVLLPALSREHSYVLTARHNVLAAHDRLETVFAPDQIVVTLPDGARLTPTRIVPSLTADAAVLLVPGIEITPVALSSEVRVKEPVWLVGYPQVRQDGYGDPMRIYPGAIQTFTGSEIKISTDDLAPVGEVRGCSGGGVFTLVDDKWVLVAVEHEMDSRPDEGHNWLQCARISVFEQLLAQNSLPPILPPFLLSFEGLASSAFPLPGFECGRTKRRVQMLLQHFARNKLGQNCPTPHDLMQKYEEQLLVSGDPRHSLADRKLWISWLELLVLSILLDGRDNVDDAYINALRKKRRLLYSGSGVEWLDFLENILLSNLDGLDKDGVVLVSNNRESPPIKSKPSRDLSKIVADISLSIGEEFDIGMSRKPVAPRHLFHLDGLHRDCVVHRESEYSVDHGHDHQTLLKILTEAYRAALE